MYGEPNSVIACARRFATCLPDGGKTVNRFRRQNACAVEEKLMEAAIANLRLAEIGGE